MISRRVGLRCIRGSRGEVGIAGIGEKGAGDGGWVIFSFDGYKL